MPTSLTVGSRSADRCLACLSEASSSTRVVATYEQTDAAPVAKSGGIARHELSSTTASIASPYFATLAGPMPGTDSSSDSLPGRRSAMAASVASVATT